MSQPPTPDMPPGYGQVCAVALGLDAIGDRWTLLVLRDLARAPLRFSDVQAINTSMSPNLLTDRLRKLEAAGLVERRREDRPANRTVYALTDEARAAVLPVLTAVAGLGVFLIEEHPPESLATLDLAAALVYQMELNGNFVVARGSDLRGRFLIDLGGLPVHILIDDAGFHTSADAPDGAGPSATITVFPPTELMRIMGRVATVADAEAGGLLAIEGDRPAALELLRLLTFEPLPATGS